MHSSSGVVDFAGQFAVVNIADHIAALAYFVLIIGGLIGLAIRPARGVCGFALYVASGAVAVDVWLWSIVTVKSLWGTVATIIGLLLALVGVIPMALVASLFHREWLPLGYVIINLVILYFMQFAAGLMLESSNKRRMLAARHPDIGGSEGQQSERRIEREVAEYIKEDMKRESWIEHTAAQYLEDDLSKNAFFTFTRESPAMKLAFHNAWGRTLSPERPLTRGRLTIIFNEVAIQLASSGDSEGSDRGFACSSLFIKRNPLTWAALAEVALTKKDRMAATWAEKVIKFRLQKTASPELREFLSTDEAKVLLRDARQRMRQIVAVCQASTSWHDSTEVFNQMGVAKSYFDR